MNTKLLAMAATTALGVTLAAGSAYAAADPFQINKLTSGYTIAMSDTPEEGKCGEGKCGGDKAKEAKCGGDKASTEGKCGGDKAMTEGKCGGDKATTEGKCGAK